MVSKDGIWDRHDKNENNALELCCSSLAVISVFFRGIFPDFIYSYSFLFRFGSFRMMHYMKQDAGEQ